jgi:hypothetical protein
MFSLSPMYIDLLDLIELCIYSTVKLKNVWNHKLLHEYDPTVVTVYRMYTAMIIFMQQHYALHPFCNLYLINLHYIFLKLVIAQKQQNCMHTFTQVTFIHAYNIHANRTNHSHCYVQHTISNLNCGPANSKHTLRTYSFTSALFLVDTASCIACKSSRLFRTLAMLDWPWTVWFTTRVHFVTPHTVAGLRLFSRGSGGGVGFTSSFHFDSELPLFN